jgi:hypothetical protein
LTAHWSLLFSFFTLECRVTAFGFICDFQCIWFALYLLLFLKKKVLFEVDWYAWFVDNFYFLFFVVMRRYGFVIGCEIDVVPEHLTDAFAECSC